MGLMVRALRKVLGIRSPSVDFEEAGAQANAAILDRIENPLTPLESLRESEVFARQHLDGLDLADAARQWADMVESGQLAETQALFVFLYAAGANVKLITLARATSGYSDPTPIRH